MSSVEAERNHTQARAALQAAKTIIDASKVLDLVDGFYVNCKSGGFAVKELGTSGRLRIELAKALAQGCELVGATDTKVELKFVNLRVVLFADRDLCNPYGIWSARCHTVDQLLKIVEALANV